MVRNDLGRRYYADTSDLVAFESTSFLGPIVTSRQHVSCRIPAKAFTAAKRIGSKLFGTKYCLKPSEPDSEHWHIKIIELP